MSWRIHFEALSFTDGARSDLWEAVADLETWNGSVRLPGDSLLLRLAIDALEPRSIRRAIVGLTETIDSQLATWKAECDEDTLRAADGLLALLGNALKLRSQHPAAT